MLLVSLPLPMPKSRLLSSESRDLETASVLFALSSQLSLYDDVDKMNRSKKFASSSVPPSTST